MNKYIKISNDITLIQQPIKVNKKDIVKARKSINHIWIYDRSGSMSGDIKDLCRQMKTLSKGLPKGDTLTLGWFSGTNEYNFVVKGFKISDDSDYKSLERIIDSNSDTIGATCFSEILANTSKVIEDLKVFSDVYSLNFFTDGHPTVGNYNKEVEDIMKAIKAIKGSLKTAMLIGYGRYYNKELMGQMAEKLGAVLIHNTVMEEFTNSVSKLVSLTESSEDKVEVEVLSKDNWAVFQVADEGVIITSVDEDKLSISPTKEVTYVYYLSKESIKATPMVNLDEELVRAFYASTLVLNQLAKTDKALEVIGTIGDKYIIDKLYNAFTLEDHSVAEEVIKHTIYNRTLRGSTGIDTSYLPKEDAFCAVEALERLISDSEAYFYPTHESFSYKRASRETKTKEGYPKFNYVKNSKCPFNSLKWNATKLNLSVSTKIFGSINLNEVESKKASDVGFSEVYPTYVHRNYTFIKDGLINIKTFLVSTSADTFKFFQEKGIVGKIYDDGTYELNFSSIPSINRAIANGKTSARELCELTLKSSTLEARRKVLKYFKDEEFPESKTSTNFTEEQSKFLEANGISLKDGSFSPPSEQMPSVDQNIIKEFDIKFHSMSSLPSVSSVLDEIKANKNLKKSSSYIKEGIDWFNSKKILVESFNENLKKEWYENTVKDLNKEISEINSKINQVKFAVILGKKWFDEFPSRADNNLVIDGNSFTFSLKETVEKI